MVFCYSSSSGLRLLPYDPITLLMGIYLKEMKTYAHKKNFVKMFTETLFIMASKLEITQMPVNRMDKQLWNIHTMKCYLAISLSSYAFTFIFTPESVHMENCESTLMPTILI